jgi:hypothetical protein
MKPLFSFLNVPLNPKYHWNDSSGWVMAECLHKQVLNKMRNIVASSRYLVLSCDEVTTIDNQLWISNDLVDCTHNTMHLKWKTSFLDLNTSKVEYLCFDYASYTFWATSLDAHGQKMQVSWEIFNGLVDATKTSCSIFLFQPILSLSSFEFV